MNKTVTVEDIIRDPNAYGMPSFDQFRKDPDKFRDSEGARMGRLDQGSRVFNNLVEKQTYKYKKWETTSLEEFQRVLKNEGKDFMNMKLCPQVIPTKGGKCEIVIEVKDRILSLLVDALGKPFRK